MYTAITESQQQFTDRLVQNQVQRFVSSVQVSSECSRVGVFGQILTSVIIGVKLWLVSSLQVHDATAPLYRTKPSGVTEASVPRSSLGSSLHHTSSTTTTIVSSASCHAAKALLDQLSASCFVSMLCCLLCLQHQLCFACESYIVLQFAQITCCFDPAIFFVGCWCKVAKSSCFTRLLYWTAIRPMTQARWSNQPQACAMRGFDIGIGPVTVYQPIAFTL